MPKIDNFTKSFLMEQLECVEKLSKQQNQIEKIINLLIKKRNNGKNIFTIGNGGSASTASHFVSDLLKTSITKNNKRFKAISLVDNIPVVLAWANDTSYEEIFVEQLKNQISKGDVVIAFSGSGKSKNIIKALKFAKKNGAICIGFSGMHGVHFPKLCNIGCFVPSNVMLIIESTHVIVCHCIVNTIRNMGKPLFQYE